MVPTRSRFARCPNSCANLPASVLKAFLSLALILAMSSGLRAEQPAAAASPAQAASPAPKKKKDQSGKSENKEEEAKTDDDQFGFIQKGKPVKGIRIPHYGDDGKLQMMFDAAEAVKVDDTHVKLKDLKIDATGDDGKKFYVELPSSVFNLETRILDGDERVLIRREDFEITGDAGQFEVKKRFARIKGNVKMIIYSTEDLNP